MKIKSFSINNFGNPCYVTCLPVMDILDRMVVDEWSPENRFGYQRVLDPRRVGGGRLSLLKSIESPGLNEEVLIFERVRHAVDSLVPR